MVEVIRSKDSNIESYKEAVYPSEILPPSYLDILVEKCLIYHEKVFGRCAKEEMKEIIDCAHHNTQSKSQTFHCVRYNNNVYNGELDAKGRKHGVGTCKFSNGDIYRGSWNKDDMHGRGYYYWNHTSNVYIGQWSNRNRHGNGVYVIVTRPMISLKKDVNSQNQTIFKFSCGKWKNDFTIQKGQINFVETC